MEGGVAGSSSCMMMSFGDNNDMTMMPFMEAISYSQDMETNNNNNNSCIMRAKIMAHPLFPRLLSAYVNCQKVITLFFFFLHGVVIFCDL